jgi:hypothetical protein
MTTIQIITKDYSLTAGCINTFFISKPSYIEPQININYPIKTFITRYNDNEIDNNQIIIDRIIKDKNTHKPTYIFLMNDSDFLSKYDEISTIITPINENQRSLIVLFMNFD